MLSKNEEWTFSFYSLDVCLNAPRDQFYKAIEHNNLPSKFPFVENSDGYWYSAVVC